MAKNFPEQFETKKILVWSNKITKNGDKAKLVFLGIEQLLMKDRSGEFG